MTGVLLALAASGAWGVSDVVGGAGARRLALPAVLLPSQLAGLATLLVLQSVLGGGADLPAAGLTAAALAGASGVVALGLLYLAMARQGTAVVAPIAGGSAALPVVVGLLRGEALTARTAVGIACALGGALLAARRGSAESGRRRDVVALAAAAGSAACSGLFLVFIQGASDTGQPLVATLVARVAGCALVAAWALGRWPELRPLPGAGPMALGGLATVGAGDAVAEVCFAGASGRVPLSVASPLASLYPTVAVVLAVVFLRERLDRTALAGLLVGGIAVALLAPS